MNYISGRLLGKIIGCQGCGQQVELSGGSGHCEWCNRRYLEEVESYNETVLFADGIEYVRIIGG